MCDNEEATTLVHDTVAHDEETRTVPNESSSAPAPSNDETTNAEDSDFEGETFTISSTLFERLRDMGFSENAIKKSIASGCINEDTCTQWITMHLGHAELDTPLDATAVRVIVKVQRILTEEEKAARAAELKELIKAKKASEAVTSAQQERENEKKRIEMGKLMHEAKELREAAQRQNAAEERRREKEADIKAREKAQIAILVDRYVRGGKTPEEAARIVAEEFEERKKRQREEAAEKLKTLSTPEVASAPTSEWNLGAVLGVNPSSSNNVANHTASVFAEPLVPPPTAETFSSLVAAIIAESQPATSSISTLRMILTNISEAPLESKKRTLRVTSNVFRNNIAPFPSAVRFLRVLNFELTNDAEGQEFVSQHSVVLRWLYRALEALPKQ